MSAVICRPAPNTESNNPFAWPDELRGDGFIDLNFHDTEAWNMAYYTSFPERYQVYRFDSGLIVADVRED